MELACKQNRTLYHEFLEFLYVEGALNSMHEEETEASDNKESISSSADNTDDYVMLSDNDLWNAQQRALHSGYIITLTAIAMSAAALDNGIKRVYWVQNHSNRWDKKAFSFDQAVGTEENQKEKAHLRTVKNLKRVTDQKEMELRAIIHVTTRCCRHRLIYALTINILL